MSKFEACMKAIEIIDDYFECRWDSDRDLDFVLGVIDDLDVELKEIEAGE